LGGLAAVTSVVIFLSDDAGGAFFAKLHLILTIKSMSVSAEEKQSTSTQGVSKRDQVSNEIARISAATGKPPVYRVVLTGGPCGGKVKITSDRRTEPN